MIAAAAICFIAGALLGMRFKVAILVPAVFAVGAAILPFGILTGQTVSSIMSMEFVTLAALQFGYLSATLMAARSVRKTYEPHGATAHHSR